MTRAPRPDVGHIYIAGEDIKPIREMYVRDIDGAIRAALAADVLDLGWMVQGYRCPTGDENVTETEFRVVVWRELMSETLPWTPDVDEAGQ